MRRALFFFLLVANPTVAQQPSFRAVDLDVGATERVQAADGKTVSVKLVSTSETRDRVRSAIRDARVNVEILWRDLSWPGNSVRGVLGKLKLRLGSAIP